MNLDEPPAAIQLAIILLMAAFFAAVAVGYCH
jgi:hypothetical protein